MITVDDIKTYKSIKDKISKLVENYYQKEIYSHYMYELCDWYIKEDTNDIVINYSYIDYHGNAECDSVIVSIEKLNKFDYFHEK